MSDDRSWLTEEYPELRDGPPWVMQEMIEAQRELPAAILDRGGSEATGVNRAIRAAADRGEPIVVTGCGTSEHGSMAVAALIADALPDAWVESRQALDAALAPRAGGVCIGVSHEGGTQATLLALEAARAAGASIAAITANSESAVAKASDQVIVTPLVDRSWCHTVAYTSAILAGIAIARTPASQRPADRRRSTIPSDCGSDSPRPPAGSQAAAGSSPRASAPTRSEPASWR